MEQESKNTFIVKLVPIDFDESPSNYCSIAPIGSLDVMYKNEDFDVRAYLPLNKKIVIKPSERATIRTGYFFQVSPGYKVYIKPITEMNTEHKIILLNNDVITGEKSTNEVTLVLINFGDDPFTIRLGDVVARAVIRRI